MFRTYTESIAVPALALLLSGGAPSVPLQAQEGRAQPGAAAIESLKQTALQEAEAGKNDEAVRDYQRVLEAQPEWQEGRFNLGMIEYQSGRYPQAEDAFRKVIDAAPTAGIVWALLGLSEFETGDYADARLRLEKAGSLGMKDDPGIARVADYHLALLLIRAGEFERASDLLLHGVGGDRASAQVKTAIGLAMLRVPLLPAEVDASQEALVQAAGAVGCSGADMLADFPALLAAYPDVPCWDSRNGVPKVSRRDSWNFERS